MQKIRVNKAKLLEILKKNKIDHKSVYKEAFENYEKEVIRIMKEEIVKMEKGGKIVTSIELEEPMCHIKDYDIAIGMLNISVDKTIEITQLEYKNLILDSWHWTREFVSTNSPYCSSSSSSSILASKSMGD